MFGSNEEDYYRSMAEDFIKSRESDNKAYLEAKVMQRKSSVEAMRQRYSTMQKVATDNNALFVARKCRRCVASIDNTILAAQYKKMELIDNERSGKTTSAAFRPRTLDIESLRKRYNLDN